MEVVKMKLEYFLPSLALAVAASCATMQDRDLDSFLADVPVSNNRLTERYLSHGIRTSSTTPIFDLKVGDDKEYAPKEIFDPNVHLNRYRNLDVLIYLVPGEHLPEDTNFGLLELPGGYVHNFKELELTVDKEEDYIHPDEESF